MRAEHFLHGTDINLAVAVDADARIAGATTLHKARKQGVLVATAARRADIAKGGGHFSAATP